MNMPSKRASENWVVWTRFWVPTRLFPHWLIILSHYENNRQYEQTGKAMIVAYSRPIAIKIYNRILALRPDWTEKIAVVMTSGNQDPEEWREIIGNDARKRELEKLFKDDNSPLKIVIVVDMWLTGFDVPSL